MKTKSFVVIGLDRFGLSLVETLSAGGHQILAIDKSEEAVSAVSDIVTHSVIGDPTKESVLKAAGVKSYDCAVVCDVDTLEDSVLTTLLLKEMGIPKVVVRAGSAQHIKVLEKLGADEIVYPERDMGEKLAYRLERSEVLDYIDLSADVSIAEINVPRKWIGFSMKELNVRQKYDLNVIAVNRGGVFLIRLDPDEPFCEKDVVAVLGTNEAIARLAK